MKVREVSATVIAVVIWLVTWVAAAEDATADPYLQYGQLQNESNATFAGIGYTYKDKWDVNATFIGSGQTDWGEHPKMKVLSVSRLIYPDWTDNHFFMGLGVSKVEMDDKDWLVEAYNYKLQVGWDFGRSKIFYQHHSSGDVNDVNIGLDMIGVELKL